MWNWRHTAIAALVGLAGVGACSPADYPTEPRFEIEPVVEEPGHLFVYNVLPDVEVTSVTIPGTLVEPNWNPEQSPALENVWTVTVDLAPGTYQYKYVFNDGGWAGNMCDEGTWGHPDYENYVDPDGTGCVSGGEDAEIVIETAGPHTFRYIVPEGAPEITELHVAGSFQGWDPGATPFQETYQLWMDLNPGTYKYKFHFNGTDWAGNMCNDATWGDPDNDFKVDANVQECDGGDAVLTIE